MSQSIQGVANIGPSLAFLQHLINGYGPRDFALRFWDGTLIEPDAGQAERFALAFNHAGAVRQMFWPFNKAAVGEAYIYDDFDIEGDIQAFFDFTKYLRERHFGFFERCRCSAG